MFATFGVQNLEKRDLMAVDPLGDLTVQAPPPEAVLIGLLLPAVQKVREATHVELDLTNGNDPAPGLLLPAVQKVRDAANRLSAGNLDLTNGGGDPGSALLLPAVQKVREAANRMSDSVDHVFGGSDNQIIAILIG